MPIQALPLLVVRLVAQGAVLLGKEEECALFPLNSVSRTLRVRLLVHVMPSHAEIFKQKF